MKKYLNRDISWLSFNERVLDETSKNIPLGEKILFHGISFSNFLEFTQVRYPAAINSESDQNLTELVKKIHKHYLRLTNRFTRFSKKHKIIVRVDDLDKEKRKEADRYFKQNIYPALQAITVEQSQKVNMFSGLFVIALLESSDGSTIIGYVEIPKTIDRFITLSDNSVILNDDLILHNIKSLFKDRKIIKKTSFKISRSAEVYTQPDSFIDPYKLIVKTLHDREKAWITMLEIANCSSGFERIIRNILLVTSNTLVFTTDYVGLDDLKSYPSDYRFKENEQIRKFTPVDTFPGTSIFDYIKKKDRLAFHPYESYQTSFVRFLQEASTDKNVVSIKISLYRVSNNSRIIDALLKAADSGKIVTVLIELKARFDEHHNLEIANILRESGVRIVYTKPDIKTHSKVCLVSRKEKKGLRIYSHVATGNYSEANAKQYTDYSYFSADQILGTDLTHFFNLLTSDQGAFKSKKIVYAPYNMRDEISDNIEEQIKLAKKGKPAKIIFKCNALTDDKIADKISAAADAGVVVILIIRSACILEPKKNIRIYSIVGRFLEHSRVYVFGVGKNSKLYIGSNDIMHRNLSLRNELMLLVEQEDIRKRIRKHLDMYLNDTVNRRKILDKYKYEPVLSKKDKPFNSQEAFIKEAKKISLS